jgi:predicted ATP-dependent endonuclease of OLD family
MRLKKARVQNYRSIIDSGEFDIEELKTILVGPNEAGKTVLLKALQQLNKPAEVPGFEALRDYPRSLLNDIDTGKVSAEDVTVVTGYFELDQADKELIPPEFQNCTYKYYKNIDNSTYHDLIDAPPKIHFKEIKNDFSRLIAHLDKQYTKDNPDDETKKPGNLIKNIIDELHDNEQIDGEISKSLKAFLTNQYALIDEENVKEEERYQRKLC